MLGLESLDPLRPYDTWRMTVSRGARRAKRARRGLPQSRPDPLRRARAWPAFSSGAGDPGPAGPLGGPPRLTAEAARQRAANCRGCRTSSRSRASRRDAPRRHPWPGGPSSGGRRAKRPRRGATWGIGARGGRSTTARARSREVDPREGDPHRRLLADERATRPAPAAALSEAGLARIDDLHFHPGIAAPTASRSANRSHGRSGLTADR